MLCPQITKTGQLNLIEDANAPKILTLTAKKVKFQELFFFNFKD